MLILLNGVSSMPLKSVKKKRKITIKCMNVAGITQLLMSR
jgi:hypothetical protein